MLVQLAIAIRTQRGSAFWENPIFGLVTSESRARQHGWAQARQLGFVEISEFRIGPKGMSDCESADGDRQEIVILGQLWQRCCFGEVRHGKPECYSHYGC
jgi:hypothetical protein